MITNILINALGQAIFESCGQALLIYVSLQLFMQLFPGITSKYRYRISYLALTVICGWFLVNLITLYLHAAALPNYTVFIYGGATVYGSTHAPTLLQQAEAFISAYAKYITGLYMIGLMLHVFKLLGGFVHIHHIRQKKNLSKNSLWSAKAWQLGKQLEVVKTVSLYFSEHIQIPLTIGHLKPIIIFPLALVNNLDNDQVEAILMHELAHIKRNDYLLNIFQCVMETILCFNPFAWLISKAIREQREYCCDDMVVNADCNNFSYSKALLVIAQQNSHNYALAMASTGTNKYPLLNRIKRLHTMKTKDSLPKFHLLIIVAIAAIGTLLAWGIPQYSVAKTAVPKTKKAVLSPLNTLIALTTLPVENKPLSPITHKKKTTIVYTDTATNTSLLDTTKNSKSKFKIVLSENGNTKEYNSVEEMPEADKAEFLRENPRFGAFNFKFNDSMKFAALEKMTSSPEWKKQMLAIKIEGEKMRKQFNSPEWKKQMRDVNMQAMKMKMKFNSPEWKKQMEDMKLSAEKMQEKFNSPEWRKQQEEMQEDMRKQFESPEWKKQMEDMQLSAEKMKEQFNSPEWKKQMKDMKMQAKKMSKQFNSPEWKRQMKDMQKQAEKMKEQFNSPKWKKQMEDMQKKVQDERDDEGKKAAEDTVSSGN